MNKRLGDNIWDTEIPDDDDANLHVHTHFMNNYNPAEHPETFKPQINLEIRRRNNIPQTPFKDTEDGLYPHGHEHETDELAGNKILHYDTRGTNRKESLPENLKENLHDNVCILIPILLTRITSYRLLMLYTYHRDQGLFLSLH